MARAPRVIRLVRAPAGAAPGVFCISQGRHVQFYAFKEIPCDIGGRGFAVHRLGLGDLYHVRVGAPADSSCECKGYYAHGHCKHLQGLAALLGHGLV